MSTRVDGAKVTITVSACATLSAGTVHMTLTAREGPVPGIWQYNLNDGTDNRPGHVADQPRVGHAALGAGRRGGVVGAGARGVAVVEVRHEGVVACRGEPRGDLLGRRVVAGM